MKRLFDIAVSLVAMILLSPIFLVVAVLVRMKLGSPVESGSGATLNVEMVGYALACGVGVIATGVLWLAPVTLSVAPVTWIDAPDAAQDGMLR